MGSEMCIRDSARAYSDDGASSGAGGYRAVDDATSAISVYEQCSSDECDHIYSGAGIVLWKSIFGAWICDGVPVLF